MTGVESTLNAKLAEILDEARNNWTAEAEQRGVLRGGGQVDVLVRESGWPNVIVECKVGLKPEDVLKRFNNRFKDGTRPSVVFEVKYDESLRTGGDLAESKLHYCVHYDKHTRFPRSGWLAGTARDLSVSIQYGRESPKYVRGADLLNDAISEAASVIGDLSEFTREGISKVMGQEQSPQTYAMAALTISGALRFHDMAAEPHGIPVLGQLMLGEFVDTHMLLVAWDRILEINYFVTVSLFEVCRCGACPKGMRSPRHMVGLFCSDGSGEAPSG